MIIVVFAAFWLLSKIAAGLSSINTIRKEVTGVKDLFVTLFITRRQQATKERKELREAVATVTEQNVKILAELNPNGGKSLRDDVTKLGEKVEDIASWNHYQKETDNTPIFFLDADGKMTFANSAFRDLVDADESDLMHRKYLSRIEPTDQVRLTQTIDFATLNKIPFETTVRFKNGGPGYIDVHLAARADVMHGGTLKRFFGTAAKVTV